MSFDIRFLTATPWGPSPGMLLRIFQQLLPGDDVTFEENDGSHLPMVKPVREMQRRVDSLDTATNKYRSKSAEITSALQGDLALCDDPEAKLLTENLMRVHHMLADYMEGLHPILEDQKETIKQLSEYLTPPTVELFHKKANHILKDAPLQQISMTKKNTCAICMDASADCVIKRSCCVQGGAASSSSSTSSRSHCEKDMCKCGPTMCKDCLLTHYWTSTGKGSKSYARCVCCRAEFCLKDVFPVEYVEDDAYRQMKSEQERKGKEKEREIEARRKEDPTLKDEGEEIRGSGRGRKSRKVNNTTTTTTTTTTTSSLSLSPSISPATSPRAYHHSPRVTRSSSSSSLSSSLSSSSATPSELDEAEGPTRKRRRTNSNSNNANNNNNNYNSSNNNNTINFPSTTTTTTSTTSTNFTGFTNSTSFTSSQQHNNNYNNSNNNSGDNNSNSDGEGRKYHLRSSRKNSTDK